ncbi:MAG: hypothetical protein LUC38_07570, partial [Oscillospiraceae bacterium]|nr:hypothetical protein [Oscillospiraceae bacterium]
MNKNTEKLSAAIDMVDEKYLTEAVEYKAERHGLRHRKLVAVAVAAVVCVFMMGAGYLVAYNSITDFFVR